MAPNPDGSSSLMDFSVLEGMTLIDLKTAEPRNVTLKTSCNTLVIIFAPGDCPSCLKEKRVWESLARSYDAARFQVVGIVVRASAEEAETISKALNVPFPIFYDKRNLLKQMSLAPQVTPFKVLFARDTGVLLAAGPVSRANEQEQFGEKVRSSLEDCGH
jgi:peroxiredoxin